jgi:hypothetical protein
MPVLGIPGYGPRAEAEGSREKQKVPERMRIATGPLPRGQELSAAVAPVVLAAAWPNQLWLDQRSFPQAADNESGKA